MLGDRLRELRIRHGLTLREVAAAADVSVAMLSQVENNTADPSLNTLRKLARTFDVSMADLFTETPLVHVSRPGQRTVLEAEEGLVSYERLTPPRGELEVVQGDLRPGDASAAEPWSHPATECLVVLKGQVVAEINGAQYPLTTGEAVTLDSRLPHRYVNRGNRIARILVAGTPPHP